MQVTTDFLAGVFTQFEGIFKENFDNVTTDYNQIATVMPSNTLTNTYSWLGSVPKMREWVGERQLSAMFEHDYTIKNKDFEASIEVDRDTFEDDQLGIITPRIADLGQEAKRFYDDLTFGQTLDTGFTTKGYDAVNFFSASHTEGNSGTQSNTSSNTLSDTNLRSAIVGMRGIVNDQGKNMGVNPNTLVVGPNLEFRARALLESQVVVVSVGDGTAGTGATASTNSKNVLQGRLNLIVNPYITSYHWFVADTSRAIKPLIFQMRKEPTFVALTDPNSTESVFMRKKFMYGVDGRWNTGYGLWQLAYGANATS